MSSAHVAFAQSKQPTPSSAESSPTSATLANEFNAPGSKFKADTAKLIAACNAAVEELRAARGLVSALEGENAALRARFEAEKRIARLLGELVETRKAEAEALRKSADAKDETIHAKNALIESQTRMIETLKTKKRSVFGRITDVLIGAGVAAILR
ncbi:MAG: hypothetical protein LC734_05955 [Acidobacteria bacterium]|nr:hypothetical protein [Acidobacteriota bacterium]